MGVWDWFMAHLLGRDGGEQPCALPQTAEAPSSSVATLTTEARNDAPPPPIPTEPATWWAPLGATDVTARPVPRVELSATARALEEHLISHFDGHNLTLPPLPRVAENVLGRLRSAQCSMTDVAHDLSEDPVSTATVLRMANSALYRGVEKITSLQLAVTRLGANALRTLMMHQSLRAAVFSNHADARALTELIWRGSLASATIMRELAPLLGRDEEEAFTVGLLHDIGSVVTLRLVLEHGRSTHESLDTDTFDYLCYETHQEFGELIANAWQLPRDLKALISDHHIYPSADDPLRIPRLSLILTDMICQMLGYAPLAQYDLLNATVVADLRLAGRQEFVELLARLPDRIATVAEEFN